MKTRVSEGGGKREGPAPAKIFCGLICAPEVAFEEVLEALEARWAEVEFVSAPFPFSFTRYYEPEMGPSLSRRFALFRRWVEQDALPGLKWEAREVERSFASEEGFRRVNIDPGLFLPERLVLATTKASAHRPYLQRGVYADLTLVYHAKSYRALPWTYPDYAEESTIVMMNNLRERFLLERRVAGKRG